GQNGKWTDAKSVARVLSLKAPAGQTLFFEAEGPDAAEAMSTIIELVRRNFDEGSQRERQFEGQVASAGLGDGFLVVCTRAQIDGVNGTEAANPQAERKLLEGALARAALQLERLKSDGGAIASEILDFQLELLRDSTLLEPAYRSIAKGRPAARAFAETLEAQIADYRSATDKYFAARASDPGRLIVSPSEATTRWVRGRQQARTQRAELDEKYRTAPAVSAGGTRIAVQINVESERTLEDLAPGSCDGIGLARTEFL